MTIITDYNTSRAASARLWMPRRVLFTPAALDEPWGRQIHARVTALGLPVEELRTNRLTGLQGANERATYSNAKRTMAVVTAPRSAFKLQPIPPSADWQFHLAQGCPAHCQYCYLAGSLQGPPVVRVYANLQAILENLVAYEQPGKPATFEVSCYTDPLALEHLTGSLAETIRYFGTLRGSSLRWVSKFDAVEPLLGLAHGGRTRCRISLNAEPVTLYEGGTSSVTMRLQALRRLALPPDQGGGGYPVGVVIAPIMPIVDWETHYAQLLDRIRATLDFTCDLTFELITHRFTRGSRDVLRGWYPGSRLDMDESGRVAKHTRFGSTKFVYPTHVMRSLRDFFEHKIAADFPGARILYWT